jgi:flagellar biosynthetic protein FliQ
MIEERLITLSVDMFKLILLISMPTLLVSMFVGLLISIFQATTQINEMTLTFIPKILSIMVVMVVTMPWMLRQMIEYTERIFGMIPQFIF